MVMRVRDRDEREKEREKKRLSSKKDSFLETFYIDISFGILQQIEL